MTYHYGSTFLLADIGCLNFVSSENLHLVWLNGCIKWPMIWKMSRYNRCILTQNHPFIFSDISSAPKGPSSKQVVITWANAWEEKLRPWKYVTVKLSSKRISSLNNSNQKPSRGWKFLLTNWRIRICTFEYLQIAPNSKLFVHLFKSQLIFREYLLQFIAHFGVIELELDLKANFTSNKGFDCG